MAEGRPSPRGARAAPPLVLAAGVALTALLEGCAASEGSAPSAGAEPAAAALRSSSEAAPGTYLTPNVEDADGTGGYLHVGPSDMPLRVAIARPKRPPRFGSTEDARSAAIEGMLRWEEAIRTELPWFRLEFVEEDPEAAVQVEWARRLTGDAAGRARISARVREGRLRVGGSMRLTTRVGLSVRSHLRPEKIRFLAAHEFGHVLGLRHCHECDSAMNYSWATRSRILVTKLDVATFVALCEQRSGFRVDGRPLERLVDRGWEPAAEEAKGGPAAEEESGGAPRRGPRAPP